MSDPWSGPAQPDGATDPTAGGAVVVAGTDDEELDRLIADRAPRAHLPWVTAVLVAAILLSVGYVAGALHYRGSSSSGSGGFNPARAAAREGLGGTSTPSGAPGGTTGTGSTGGAANRGGATIGTVKLVDGDNVYLTDSSGAT